MSADLECTERQLEIFNFIEVFLGEKGYPPTRQEIADEFGFKSVNAAQQHLEALVRIGAISVTPHVARGIVLLAQTAVPPPAVSPRQRKAE